MDSVSNLYLNTFVSSLDNFVQRNAYTFRSIQIMMDVIIIFTVLGGQK